MENIEYLKGTKRKWFGVIEEVVCSIITYSLYITLDTQRSVRTSKALPLIYGSPQKVSI